MASNLKPSSDLKKKQIFTMLVLYWYIDRNIYCLYLLME